MYRFKPDGWLKVCALPAERKPSLKWIEATSQICKLFRPTIFGKSDGRARYFRSWMLTRT